VRRKRKLKGLGDKAVEQILQHRPFNTAEELLFNEDISYSKLNKKALDVLARSGALNNMVDDRFTGLKHFWSAVAVDRPKKEKNLLDNIELYKPEGDFTKAEKMEFLTNLTGIYPINDVVSDKLLKKFGKLKVPPIGEYDRKTGKDYWILKTIDNESNQVDIKCWGVDPQLDYYKKNVPCMAKLDYNDTWGFSTRSFRRNIKFVELS
jgi:DNA polymerase III alpha subunit